MDEVLDRRRDDRTLVTLATTSREHERRLGVIEQQQQGLTEAFQRLLPLPVLIETLQHGMDDIKDAMRTKQQQDDQRAQFGANYYVSRESLEEGRMRDVRTSFWTVIGFAVTILIFIAGTLVQIVLTKR